MELTPWKLRFIPGWDRHFSKFDNSAKTAILKKLEQLKQPLLSRGLHSSKYKVEEAGQYRIALKIDEAAGEKIVEFVGNHKQYEKWYKANDGK